MYITAVETLGPPVEPITLPEAKKHLNVSHQDDDVYIANCIAAARLHCEEYAHISIMTKQWDMYLDALPAEGFVKLPWGKVTSIEHVKYAAAPPAEEIEDQQIMLWGGGPFGGPGLPTDPIEATAHSSQYQLTRTRQPSQLHFLRVPSPVIPIDGIWIRYKAGFAEVPASVPFTLKFAILQTMAHFYRNREAVIVSETPTPAVELPMAARATLDQYRMYWAA